VPTGVALRDARRQLFDAAERVLLRAGAAALTSRSVTTEAGCAKGVLHKHFADFDDFLAEFVLDSIGRMSHEITALRDAAGTRTVADNLTGALTALFGSVAVAMVGLVTFRDGLRARLRETWPAGVPVLTEAAGEIAAYLAAERDRGRLTVGGDADTLAAMLIGTCHLQYAGRDNTPPDPASVRKIVVTIVGGS
jgi:AcrR family transcriptional regulator